MKIIVPLMLLLLFALSAHSTISLDGAEETIFVFDVLVPKQSQIIGVGEEFPIKIGVPEEFLKIKNDLGFEVYANEKYLTQLKYADFSKRFAGTGKIGYLPQEEKITLFVKGIYMDREETKHAEKRVELSVSKEYTIAVEQAYPDELVISAKYPSGKKMNTEEFTATAIVDEKQQKIAFKKTGEGLYSGKFPAPISLGEHSLKLIMPTELGGKITETTINAKQNLVPTALLGLGILFALILIIGGADVLLKIISRIAKPREKLEEEKRHYEKLLDKIKQKHRGRHLNDEEYEKKYSEYCEKLKLIKKKLSYEPERVYSKTMDSEKRKEMLLKEMIIRKEISGNGIGLTKNDIPRRNSIEKMIKKIETERPDLQKLNQAEKQIVEQLSQSLKEMAKIVPKEKMQAILEKQKFEKKIVDNVLGKLY